MAEKLECERCKTPTKKSTTETGKWNCTKCKYIVLGQPPRGCIYVMSNCTCGNQAIVPHEVTRTSILTLKCSYCKDESIYHPWPGRVMDVINEHKVYETVRADLSSKQRFSGDNEAVPHWSVHDTSGDYATSCPPVSYDYLMVSCHSLYIVALSKMAEAPLGEELSVESPCCGQKFYPDMKHLAGRTVDLNGDPAHEIYMAKSKIDPSLPKFVRRLAKAPSPMFFGMFGGPNARLKMENNTIRSLVQQASYRYDCNAITKEKMLERHRKKLEDLFDGPRTKHILGVAKSQMKEAGNLPQNNNLQVPPNPFKKPKKQVKGNDRAVEELDDLIKRMKAFALHTMDISRRVDVFESHHNILRRIVDGKLDEERVLAVDLKPVEEENGTISRENRDENGNVEKSEDSQEKLESGDGQGACVLPQIKIYGPGGDVTE